MASIFKELVGGLEIAGAVALEVASHGAATQQAVALAAAGATTIIGGALPTRKPLTGTSSTEKNPIAPWRISYGRVSTGGTLLYDFEWGGGPGSNNVRDIVVCLASCQCAIDLSHPIEVLFDQKRLQIGTNPTQIPNPASGVGTGYGIPAPNPCSGTSFTPKWQDDVTITAMARANGVVTLTLSADIPYASPGDNIFVQGVNHGIAGSDQTFNGVFPIAQITNAPSTHWQGPIGLGTAFTFTYLSGGISSTPNITAGPASVSTEWPAGSDPTGHTWADYGNTVYVEFLSGTQALGQTFIGQLAGTPYEPSGASNGGLGSPLSPHNFGGPSVPNPWVSNQPGFASNCSAQGKALAFIRVLFQSAYFQAGLPQISFRHYGKSDIYDPRLGAYGAPGTRVYTENAALCIADFLHAGAPLSAAYNPATTYAAGAVASFQGANQTFGIDYVSAASGNTGNQPDTHASDWTPVTSTTLPVSYASNVTFGLGALCSYWANNVTAPVQYISIVSSNTGNQPDTHPSQWAALAIPVSALPDWGYRLPYATAPTIQNPEYIDVNALIAAANVCDQPVTLANGGTEPRYALNGSFELTQKRGETLIDMLTACAGRLAIVGGAYQIIPGAWYGSASTGFPDGSVAGLTTAVNLTNIAAGPVTWKYANPRDVYNGVKGTFISPFNNWQSTDFPYYAQDGYHGYSGPAIYAGDINLQADGGDRRWMELHFPFTISASTAQRNAKIYLLRSRWAGLPPCAANSFPGGGSGTFALNMAGYQFVPADILAASVPFLWSGTKTLEVGITRLKIEANDGEPTLGTELELQATDSSIYDWATTEELSPQGYQQVTFPTGTFQEQTPLPLSPGYAAPLLGDALYPQTATTTLAAAISSAITTPTAITLAGFATTNGSYLMIGSEWYLVDSGGGTSTPTVTGGQFGSTATTHSNGATVTLPIGPANCGLKPVYGIDGQGNSTVSLQVLANVPINATDTDISAPVIACTPSTNGGSLPAGVYVVALTARDAGGAAYANTDYHAVSIVTVGGSGSGSIAVVPDWAAGNDGGDLYIGLWAPLSAYTMHYNQPLSPAATSATIAEFDQTQPGGVDPLFATIEVDWWQAVHTGLFLEQVQNVTATTITLASYIASDVPANQFAGYTLALQAKIYGSALVPTGEIPVLNMPVVSNTASASATYNGVTAIYWTMTIGPNASGQQLPPLNQIVEVGDWVVMRPRFVFAAKSLYEPNIANAYYPSGDTGVEATHLAVVMTGADAGDVQVLTGGAGSSASPWALGADWAVTPATGDGVVILSATMQRQQFPGWSVKQAGLVGPIAWPSFTNLTNQAWLVRVRTLDANGNYGSDTAAPMRDFLALAAGAMSPTITA